MDVYKAYIALNESQLGKKVYINFKVIHCLCIRLKTTWGYIVVTSVE
jgi:hypothetical protein